MGSEKAPDRGIDGLYQTHFRKDGKGCEKVDADEVLMWCVGSSVSLKLPRHAEIFEQVKHMLMAAHGRGKDDLRLELRDLLGVKECCCNDVD